MSRPLRAALGLYARRPQFVAAIVAIGGAAGAAAPLRAAANAQWKDTDVVLLTAIYVVALLSGVALGQTLRAQLDDDRAELVPRARRSLQTASVVMVAAFLCGESVLAARLVDDAFEAVAMTILGLVCGFGWSWIGSVVGRSIAILLPLLMWIWLLVGRDAGPRPYLDCALIAFAAWAAIGSAVAVSSFDPLASDGSRPPRKRLLDASVLTWAWHVLDGRGWNPRRALMRPEWAAMVVLWWFLPLRAIADPYGKHMAILGGGLLAVTAIVLLRNDASFIVSDALRPLTRRRFARVVVATFAIESAMQWLLWWTCCVLVLSWFAPVSTFWMFMHVSAMTLVTMPLLVGLAAIVHSSPRLALGMAAMGLAAGSAALTLLSHAGTWWPALPVVVLGLLTCALAQRRWSSVDLA